LPDLPDLDKAQGLLITSANGLRAFTAMSDRRDLTVYAVGDASAAAARAAGFPTVFSANGDVGDLARLVAAKADPAKGPLYHAAGSKLAGDLAGDLERAGFDYRRLRLYEARSAESLSAETQDQLAAGHIDGVIIFSPRTAATFVSLVRTANLGEPCRKLKAFCLSRAVAEALAPLEMQALIVAPRPNQAALLQEIAAADPG
jgi:uroporphyrinogen-III synthase